jgi:hypothetical protein
VARASRPRFSLELDPRGRDARATLDNPFEENKILWDINEGHEAAIAGMAGSCAPTI